MLVHVDGVDAALEEEVEVGLEGGPPEDAAADLVPGEGGKVPEVEEQRLAQRDRLLDPGLVGQEREEPVGAPPGRTQGVEGHARLRRTDANRPSSSVIHRSRASGVPARRAENDSRVYLQDSSVRISSPAARASSSVGPGDPCPHRAAGAEAHLDPLPPRVVEGHVLEARGVEVRAEALVDDAEDIQVELRSDPGRVVVGRVEPRGVLHEVHPDQEPVAGGQDGGGGAEEGRQLVRVQVADGTGQEEEQPVPPGPRAGRSRAKSPTTPRTRASA